MGTTEKRAFFGLCETIVPEGVMVSLKNKTCKISNSKIKRVFV